MRVNSRKYIQRSNPHKNKYSKKIGGQVNTTSLNSVQDQIKREKGILGLGNNQVLPGKPRPAPRSTSTSLAPRPAPRQIQRPAPRQRPASPSPTSSTTTEPRSTTSSTSYLNSPSANNTFLQMLNQDVDVIALNIKKKLGITNQEASRRATELFNKMEMLKKDIYNSLHRNDDSYLEVSDNEYGNKEIKLKGNTHSIAEGKKSSERLPTDKDETINGLESIKSLDKGSGIKTLDDESNGFNNAEYMSNFTPESSVLDDNGIRKVENRLLNCQKLEYYYLKKHDEVVKLFTFILNLFDKYKYQGELLLFLLKHLVKRPIIPGEDPNRPGPRPGPGPGPGPSPDLVPGQQYKPTIRIPKAIITNISKLIKDQDKIQKVIDTMKTQIDNDNQLTKTDNNIYQNVKKKVEVEESNPYSTDANYVESNLNSSSEA